jgi:hypothetical protein
MAQAARDTGKKDAAALRLYSNSIVLFCVHYQPQTPLCSERRQSPHSRPLCEVQRKSAILPKCRNVHGAPAVNKGSKPLIEAISPYVLFYISLQPSFATFSSSIRLRRMRVTSTDLSPWTHAPLAGPFGAPPPAPCIRHTFQPRRAGPLHRFPVVLAFAVHLGAL